MRNVKNTTVFLTAILTVLLTSGLIFVVYAAGLCPGQSYDVGRYPHSIAVGDFNGDGKLDLVTANSGFDNVTVLLGDGVGRFGAARPFGAGTNPEGVAVADFNGDNKLDIVTVNRDSNDVSILLGDGSGGFGFATNYPVGVSPHSVAVADFNGDGKLDIAVANTYSQNISILLGDGVGGFGAPINTTHSGPYFVAAGDFNRDGKADLVVGHSGFGHISILLGNGQGGFSAPADIQIGLDTAYVAVGDLNGDGKLDLAVTNNINSFPSQIVVLLGDGTGGFSSPVYYNVPNHPSSISIGDFDNDGKVDLGVATYGPNKVSILPGDGTGKFGAIVNYDVQGAASTAAGDFNADGKLDLAVSCDASPTGNVSILFNSCNAVPSPSPTPAIPTYSISGQVVNGTFGITFVKLSGTQGALAGLDGSGKYSFTGLPSGGTYTVTPYSTSSVYQYTFTPPSKTFTNLSANQTADFTQTLVTNSISGRVTDTAGAGLAGIDIVLNMGSSKTQTDSNGNYSFPSLASGQSYQVSPVSNNYTFTPSRQDFSNLNSNVTANFTGTPLYNISGRVTDRAGAGIAGVSLIASGPMSRSATSDSNGNYLINSLPAGGDYIVTLSKAGYGFDPPFLKFNNLSGNQTANITGFKVFNISGRITHADGSGISGVTVNLGGSNTATIVTLSSGGYNFTNVPEGGNYTVTPSKNNYTFQPASQTFNNLGGDQSANFTGIPMLVQFSAANFSVGEADGRAAINVTRSGDLANAATVNYATSDMAGLQPCNVFNGIASSRCDYATTVGTLQFAAGESSKAIFIPIVNDSYSEGPENFSITLSNPSGAGLGTVASATITIIDDDALTGANPIINVPFFVRQQYIDFLGREPDPIGYPAWQNILNNCPPSGKDANGNFCDRIEVSAGFFRSPEFQDRGYFVFRFYPVALGRNPFYAEFMPDLAKVSGFLTDQQLEAAKVAFIQEFMSRTEFQNKYGSLSDSAFHDAIVQTAGIDPGISFPQAGMTRAQFLRAFVENSAVYQKFYNQSFVVMQYFGYLRRDPDALYTQWIQTMNQNRGDYRVMINGFMNSSEYFLRFGP